ncbi:MAG: hypothetical protein ACK56I_16635, partial [bacterium]
PEQRFHGPLPRVATRFQVSGRVLQLLGIRLAAEDRREQRLGGEPVVGLRDRLTQEGRLANPLGHRRMIRQQQRLGRRRLRGFRQHIGESLLETAQQFRQLVVCRAAG